MIRDEVLKHWGNSRPPVTFTLSREGGFNVGPATGTPTQCGFEGCGTYRYRVTIEASNEALTPEGFIIDNEWIDDYFQSAYPDGAECLSCELMAEAAIEYFVALFETTPALQDIDLNEIEVGISAREGSFLTAHYSLIGYSATLNRDLRTP